jgi:hypothetical protein
MSDSKLFEAVANLILQSISVWEDMHLYALTYSTEYNTFWELLDEDLKSTVCKHRKQNREERLVPFSMSLGGYYKGILTQESFERFRAQHWKKQLKIIMADSKFRVVMSNLNTELKRERKNEYRYLERHTGVYEGSMQVSTRVVCTNAGILYNNVS